MRIETPFQQKYDEVDTFRMHQSPMAIDKLDKLALPEVFVRNMDTIWKDVCFLTKDMNLKLWFTIFMSISLPVVKMHTETKLVGQFALLIFTNVGLLTIYGCKETVHNTINR